MEYLEFLKQDNVKLLKAIWKELQKGKKAQELVKQLVNNNKEIYVMKGAN